MCCCCHQIIYVSGNTRNIVIKPERRVPDDTAEFIPMSGDTPVGLEPNEFLPVSFYIHLFSSPLPQTFKINVDIIWNNCDCKFT